MSNIIVYRDRARAEASIYLKGYPGTPRWTERYRGPVWKPGDFDGSFVRLRTDFPSGADNFVPGHSYGGFAKAEIIQNRAYMVLHTWFDVACWADIDGGCLSGVDIIGYSHIDLDTVFSVRDGDGTIDLSGVNHPGPPGELIFRLYNLTAGVVVTTTTFGTYTLDNNHVYRLRAHAEAEGTGDPDHPATLDIRFEDSTIFVPGAPESS